MLVGQGGQCLLHVVLIRLSLSVAPQVTLSVYNESEPKRQHSKAPWKLHIT